MQHTLIQKLISRLPTPNLYPTKHKKEEKKDPVYSHISNHYFEKEDEETGVVSIRRIGLIYRREVAKQPSKRDIHRQKVKNA